MLRSFLLTVLILISTSAYSETRIRIMAGNLTTGKKQSYDPGEGIRIIHGLQPDVVLLQEFNYKTNCPEDIQSFVDQTIGEKGYYYRESEASDQIPNGILSRYPIIQSGEWEDAEIPNRDFAWARIDIPGDHDLWVVSVHLSNKESSRRAKEANAILEYLAAQNIPADDYIAVGGDFNSVTKNELVVQAFSTVLAEPGAPKDTEGRITTNMTYKKAYDWVLGNDSLNQYLAPIAFDAQGGDLSFPYGFIFNSTKFPDLGCFPGVLPTDSMGNDMQHFPVVKDFLVP